MTFLEPKLGVIEGFYGKPWAREAREAMVEWLPPLGIDNYLYAPKADAILRKRWREGWRDAELTHLENISKISSRVGLSLYLGLSPYALYAAYSPADRLVLQHKVRQITDLGVAGIALLFDDMPGDLKDLADRQLAIIDDVAAVLGSRNLLVCPTYYSDDPVLDRVFGQRPDRYLETLAAGLRADTQLFWTGPQVCSQVVAKEHLETIQKRCGDRLHLWDNYPVNDSKTRSDHLYVQPVSGRSADAAKVLRGHWFNAMNQPALSLPAIASLPALYGKASPRREAVMQQAGVSEDMVRACEPLAVRRRDELDGRDLEALRRVAAADSMAGRELSDWLDGLYTFDPACLTD